MGDTAIVDEEPYDDIGGVYIVAIGLERIGSINTL